eukprot:scaffold3256_cov444-Prasinococcus_capsulatus_cf.AAC.5
MSPNAVATGLAADNCVCVVYFLALFALARMWGEGGEEASERKPDDALADAAPLREGRGFVTDCSVAVAASASICAASSAIVSFFGVPQNMLAVTTALVVLLASVFPSLFKSLSNTGEELAAVLLQIFFAAVGAAAGNIMSVRGMDKVPMSPYVGPGLSCGSIQIFVHLGFILAAGKLFKLEVRQVLVASNANIGGPTTAAAFINTFGWRQLLVPGILVSWSQCAWQLGRVSVFPSKALRIASCIGRYSWVCSRHIPIRRTRLQRAQAHVAYRPRRAAISSRPALAPCEVACQATALLYDSFSYGDGKVEHLSHRARRTGSWMYTARGRSIDRWQALVLMYV